MYHRNLRIINLNREWKDKLKNEILYTKDIVRILEAELDKWLTTEDGKRTEQFNRNLNYYKNKVEELNLEWQKQITDILKKETH